MQADGEKFFPNQTKAFSDFLGMVGGKKIAVVGHMRPDGDCISSQVAFAKVLRDAGAKQVVCLNKHEVPYLYKEFVNGEVFLPADEFNEEGFEIVTVDCADYKRTSEALQSRYPQILAAIDHHVSNQKYAKFSIVEPTASATAELIAGLLLDANMPISKDIAQTLFMGIMTDTRQLTTSSTNLRSFEVSSKLVKCGASPSEVSILLYQREKFARMKLLCAFLQSLTMHFDGRVCIGVLNAGVFERTGAKKEDTDGLVDYARNIEGVEIAVLLEVLAEGGVKGSIRAKYPEAKVNEIAELFGGGGHHAAAGFNVKMAYEDFYPELLKIIGERLKA